MKNKLGISKKELVRGISLGLFLFASYLFLTPHPGSAHGLVTTQMKQVGHYGIEFEYNTIGNIVAGDYTLFDVYLVNPDDLSGLNYDSSFVRIAKKDGPAVFAANLATSKDTKGYAGFSATINEPGQYVVTTTFYAGGKQITQADFEFTVEAGQGTKTVKGNNSLSWPILVGTGAILVALGFGIGRLVGKQK